MSINKNNRFSMKSVTIDSKDPMLFSCGDPFDDDTPSEISISSEEGVGSGSDCDQRVRARPIQEIWDKTSLSNSLMVSSWINFIPNNYNYPFWLVFGASGKDHTTYPYRKLRRTYKLRKLQKFRIAHFCMAGKRNSNQMVFIERCKSKYDRFGRKVCQ